MKDFHVWIWLLNYDPLKISAVLATAPKHNAIFAKIFEIRLDYNVASPRTHVHLQSKNHSEVISFCIFRCFTKGTMSPK